MPTLNRRIASFRYAFAGIAYLLRTQPNARIHAAIASLVVLAGLWLGLPAHDWAVLALTMGLVFAAESFNTAIEALVDLASPDSHPLAKVAKDLAAGAVLLAALAAVAVGLCILGPPLWARMGQGWMP